jgi:hypothetical protein
MDATTWPGPGSWQADCFDRLPVYRADPGSGVTCLIALTIVTVRLARASATSSSNHKRASRLELEPQDGRASQLVPQAIAAAHTPWKSQVTR